MAQVIPFEEKAVARLRERLGEAVEANAELIAFAQGHWGAVASINAAVLATIGTTSTDELVTVITTEWPKILGTDFLAIALVGSDGAVRADANGTERVEPAFVERMLAPLARVELRSVASGHPLFGPSVGRVRAEALIRFGGPWPSPRGLLALGQRDRLAIESTHGTELLRYLGDVLAETLRRFDRTA